jgi:DNA invertase Pin-like site-specific DNA recombinase
LLEGNQPWWDDLTVQKAFGYLRVSGKGQLEGDGFSRQRQSILEWALAQGVEILRWFDERAVGGATELENRPALQELIGALHSNRVNLVVIEKLDRLARDLMVQETIIADLRKDGFELISVHEPDLCSDDPTRKLTRQIMGAIAEYDRAMIVMKLRAARQRKRDKEGRCEGRKRYGSHQNERAILEQMLSLKKSGLNYTSISANLNSQRILTRSGGLWYPATVSRILARQ